MGYTPPVAWTQALWSQPNAHTWDDRYDELEEWIRDRLDKENLTPGKYYPPDEEVKALFLKEKAEKEAKPKL
jgi:hypothetical protein